MSTKISNVKQTKYGYEGNCWQAAIASLLGLRLEDVPDFVHERYPVEKNENSAWEYEEGVRLNPFHWQDTQTWLRERGLYMVEANSFVAPHVSPLGFHLKGGKSPRGFDHVVVGLGEATIHDPHPDDGGLVSYTEYYWIIPDPYDTLEK